MSSASNPLPRVQSAPTCATWDATAFVWSVWVLMLGAALWFAWTYGSPYPYFDDFGLIHEVTGEFPITGEWLWRQYNDHRIPLPRLLWVGLYRGFGGDFRAGMVLNILGTGMLAAALTHAARKIRGQTSYADAFFPLLFLTWQAKMSLFLWSFILQLTLSTVLAGMVLAIIASHRTSPRTLTIVSAGVCVALLPLCGANGVVMAPVLACWLGFVGVRNWLVDRQARSAFVPFGMSALALGVVAAYFIDFHKDVSEASGDLLSALKSSFMFITMAFGMSAELLHRALSDGLQQFFVHVGPASWAQKRWPYALVGGAAGIAFIVYPLVRVWISRPAERFRVIGLVCFLAACACLTLAIGFGRGGGSVTEQYRYIVLATPLFACVYLIWTLLGGGAGRLVQIVFFVLFCILLPRNMEIALQSAREDRTAIEKFRVKMNDGVPLMNLVDEFANVFVLEDDQPARERLAGYILLMKKHGDKHYSALRHDNLPRNVRIDPVKPLPPGLLLDSGWHGVIDGRLWSGVEPVLKFWLSEKQKTQPLRLRMMAGTFGPQPFDVILNGARIATSQDDGGPPHIIEIDLPPLPDVNHAAKPGELREYNVLKFTLPKTRSKKTAGKGEDDRLLGLGVSWLEFVAN